MSDNWTVVKKKKKTKKKYINKQNYNNPKNKPKLNNNVKEKILKYCQIKDNDYKIFHSWKHFYIMGNILTNNLEIYRSEEKLLLLEYLNKFKTYINYKKGTEEEFINILSKINMTKEQIISEMNKNNLYYKNKPLQEHPLFKNFEKNYLEV